MIQIQNSFLSSIVKNPRCKSNLAMNVHACPFCRCKSLQIETKIVIERKSRENFRILPFRSQINNNTQNSIADNKVQNVYYRTFDSPKRGRISPRSCSKKIVIQYSSPQRIIQNTTTIQSLSKPHQNKINNLPIISSQLNRHTPRTIYTDANTPPKSKYLQRKNSRKSSQQKHQYANPFQNLTLVQSEKVKKPPMKFSHGLIMPYKALEFKVINQQSNKKCQKKKQNDLLWMKKLDFLEQIPQISTTNRINKTDSAENSASPFNSLVQATPQSPLYGSSQSTYLPKDISKSKQFIPSIDLIVQFNDEVSEVNLTRKSSKPFQNSNDQSTPQSFNFKQKWNKQNKQKFDRTEGKYMTGEKETENQLIYSQSYQITINNYGGFQRNIYVDQSLKLTQNQTRSDQNIRVITDVNNFQKSRDKFVILQISDGLQTRKSKSKTEENSLNNSKKSIKFNFVQDQRRSKLSGKINENIVGKQTQIPKLERRLENLSIQSQSIQSFNQNVDNSAEYSKSFYKQDSLVKDNSVEKASEPIQSQDYQYESIKGNQNIRELGKQMKLNYDYYNYLPAPVFPSFG